MSIIDTLVQDFSDKTRETKSHKCPMTGETFYFKPKPNVLQQDKYLGLIAQSLISGYVELVVLRCLDKNGTRLFKPADKQKLLSSVDPDILISWGNVMLDADAAEEPNLTEAQATKN